MIAVSLLLVSFTNQAFAYDNEKLVVLQTNLGIIVIEFFHEDAPNHTDNFIGLAESGFYDGTIFHRIIPGFMIQGGDPNTISGDPTTWGQGGPTERVDAEFNTIKHNRGIVSMARSADPNSGGSQFFIIHKNSNFLDEQYTVFGRIATEESFETLDKIAGVEIGDRDRPIDTEQVKITKATAVNRSEVSNLLELSEPERTQSTITPSSGNQRFESSEHEIAFNVPEGWLLQQPEKTQENSPDIVAVGPKVGVINPVISLTIQQTNQRTFDVLISEKNESLKEATELGSLFIISKELTNNYGVKAYIINAEGYFSSNDENLDIKFKEVMLYGTEKFYTFAYSNDINDFDSQLPRFEETVNSFEILSKNSSMDESIEQSIEEGGCLIATATFGSELAPQVQQLRELRDNQLLNTESGTIFMTGFNQLYYLFSPTIADFEREHPAFKEAVKLAITPMISSLSILNYIDINSEVEIIVYGISLIILNLGMYFVAPAIIIYKIRQTCGQKTK
ncbi:peptidylprolyl isomerase [Marine Group I thaumarchaeote]|uniref:peptidylprolyl isomerase n=1 Tax=Marine Group I thaumarchaeote TaxID=2511932 RepID=A0A7K4M738_9ARCH|nr:peptidylprolyl isomerase [Marine Group I thaumarchaeote]